MMDMQYKVEVITADSINKFREELKNFCLNKDVINISHSSTSCAPLIIEYSAVVVYRQKSIR